MCSSSMMMVVLLLLLLSCDFSSAQGGCVPTPPSTLTSNGRNKNGIIPTNRASPGCKSKILRGFQ